MIALPGWGSGGPGTFGGKGAGDVFIQTGGLLDPRNILSSSMPTPGSGIGWPDIVSQGLGILNTWLGSRGTAQGFAPAPAAGILSPAVIEALRRAGITIGGAAAGGAVGAAISSLFNGGKPRRRRRRGISPVELRGYRKVNRLLCEFSGAARRRCK